MISVLLVDDEPGLLELGTIYLEKTGEFSVDTAPSAQNALEMMESTRYDAIVSDFQMPGMDGIEFLKTIRSRNDTTPFIIFTGKGREEVVIEALNAGVDFYLQKGGNPKAQFAELANKIQYAVSRMRAEEALRESEERYRRIFSGMPSAVAIYEACDDGDDFIIRDLNPRAEEIEQIAKDDVIGRRVTEVFPGVKDFGLFSVFQQVWRTGRPGYLPDAIYRDARDPGTWRENWVYRLPSGEIVAIYNDITERKQTVNALRESEEKFRTLFETMTPGVFYQRSDGTLIDANPAALEMFRLTREEFVGRDSHDPYWEVISETGEILPPEKHPSMIALRTGTPVRDMIVGLHHPPEDDITWLSVNATPLYRDGETDPHQVVATMCNITDLKQADIELFRRQKIITGMLDGIPDIVGLMLPDYTVVRYNRAGYEALGYEALGMTPGEVEGKKCFELIGRDEPCEMCATRQALGTKKTESVEKFVPELGKYFECSSTPILDENGDVELIIERLHDITGRIREEERSRIMAEMVDIAPSSITVHDYEGNFLFANQKTFDIHGYSRSEFLNMNLQDLDVPESAAHIKERMKRVAERGEDTFEVRHWRKDGSTIPLEVTVKQVEWAGKPALLRIANDITERKHAEESLREREAFLSSIFRAAPTGIGVVRDRILLDANDRLCEITGYTLEEMVGQSARLLYPTVEEYEFVGRTIYDPAQRSGTGTAETRWKRRDGTIRDILITSTALDPTDPEKGVLFTALDITEQKRAWSAFRQAHRKLTILSGITRHDILNNINVMNGYIDLLEDAMPGDEQIRGYIRNIDRMSEKIERQIEFTRVYENLGSEEPEYQDLDAIIDALAVPDTITIRTSGTHAEIFADPLLKKVFENLLGNSVGHGGDVSHISVTGEVTDGDLVVRWEDDGVGVPAADKERIFERGFGKNHGLGLFLVREILDLTGISIRETGEDGAGARFEMRVPQGMYRLRE
ncbi:MAG: PAS domain S-box protein [Methanomicrobiales archaeon]